MKIVFKRFVMTAFLGLFLSCAVGLASAAGGEMTVFGTRGTVTPTAPMYGSFALVNPSVIYIAVLGQTLKTLGYTQNPLDLPNVRVYDASGKDVLQNASGGVTVSSCPGSAAVNTYYATVRGAALDANDTCVSASLPAGVYSFTINPNTSSSSGELLFEVTVNPIPPAGGVMTVFGTRGTVTPTAPMYGSFALINPSVIYIAVLGQTLKTLGYTQNPLDLPNVRVYDASGKDVLQNASGGVTVSSCPGSATVNTYYATVRGAALDANDTCVSASLPAGVYSFTINPNTSSSSGELLFEVTVNPAAAGTSPVASSFPLRNAWNALTANGFTRTFTISGTCTGTATLTQGKPSAATFEGAAGLAVVKTASMSFANCTPASLVSTTTDYYDTNYVPRGHSVAGEDYGIFPIAPIIPATVKVGDTGVVGTENIFTDSSKTTAAGTDVLSYVIEPDTASTAIVNFVFEIYDASGILLGTEQDRYRIDQLGTLTLMSLDIQYANGSTTHLVLTAN